MRRSLRLTALTLLAAAAPATAAPPVTSFNPTRAAGPSEVVPGVTYERRATPGQVAHIIRVRPGPLVALDPVLTSGSLTTRGTLTGAMRALAPQGAVAGVNADYFNLSEAFPSGLLLTGGELVKEPEPSRSALAIGPGTSLAVSRMALQAAWQEVPPPGSPPPPVRAIQGVNRPAQRSSETILYTPRFGRPTPAGPRTEAAIAIDGGATPTVGATLAGTVVAIGTTGGTPLPAGRVVLTGVGTAGKPIAALTTGTRVQIALGVTGLPAGAATAIGGGPVLVQGGRPVVSAGEGFTASQLDGGTARTAVGQAADGTVLLVTTEGPQQGSRGVTVAQQAGLMAALGARTAIGMDSGGSALMALGDRLVIPWQSERAISDALVVRYGGVQLSAPAPKISPNRDGVDDATQAVVHAPGPGILTVTLTRRGGGARRTLLQGPVAAGDRVLAIPPPHATLRDGPYRLHAGFAPADGSAPTSQDRDLVVDATLGQLAVRAAAARAGRRVQPSLRVAFTLRHVARVTAQVRDRSGRVVAGLASGRRLSPGRRLLVWDRRIGRRPSPAGPYTVSVEARSSYGATGLQTTLALGPGKPQLIGRSRR